MIPLIPLLLLSTGGWYGYKYHQKRKAFTPERRAIYERAMNSAMPPEQLQTLAAAFEKEGLTAQALLLRKRAALRSAPPEVKAQRKAIFVQAMNSQNPDAILQVAQAHEDIGAVGAAQDLRFQAETLKAVKDA